MRKFSFFIPFLVIAVLSCNTAYQAKSVQYKDYRLTAAAQQNENINVLLKPYSDSVNNSMNGIIAVSEITLEKKQPEGTLGNLLADAMLSTAKQKYNTAVDFSLMNNGGIRLPSLAAGNITRGKVFELAPFDNIIVLQKLNGKTLQELLNHISGKGGWPASGISWQIKDKKAINITVGGAPLNELYTYTMATLDYVANGGDDCVMLRPIPQINNGYLFRDAVIEYFTSINKQGKKISSKIENRVTNVQ